MFRRIFAQWYFNRAVKRANKAWQLTGKRHYVVPDDNMNLLVVDREYIKTYNKETGKKINAIKLLEMALYATPVGNFNFRSKIIVK